MIYWAGAGLLAGWIMSRGLRGTRYGVMAMIVAVVAMMLAAAAHRFETESLLACLLFWITAQIAWFVGNLLNDAPLSEQDAEKAESSLG